MKRDCVREIIVESTRGWWLIYTVPSELKLNDHSFKKKRVNDDRSLQCEFSEFHVNLGGFIHPTTLYMLRNLKQFGKQTGLSSFVMSPTNQGSYEVKKNKRSLALGKHVSVQ